MRKFLKCYQVKLRIVNEHSAIITLAVVSREFAIYIYSRLYCKKILATTLITPAMICLSVLNQMLTLIRSTGTVIQRWFDNSIE